MHSMFDGWIFFSKFDEPSFLKLEKNCFSGITFSGLFRLSCKFQCSFTELFNNFFILCFDFLSWNVNVVSDFVDLIFAIFTMHCDEKLVVDSDSIFISFHAAVTSKIFFKGICITLT
jgi:hypothetical protein